MYICGIISCLCTVLWTYCMYEEGGIYHPALLIMQQNLSVWTDFEESLGCFYRGLLRGDVAEVTLTLKQRAQAVMTIKERIETGVRAEKIGRTGRRDIDHEGSVQKALPTVGAIVKVRVKGRYLCPPFLKLVKMNRYMKYLPPWYVYS